MRTRGPRLLADARGFTLVELLVAMTIAAVGFLGLAATHVTALRATGFGRAVSVAALAASEQIEVLRRIPYDEVASGEAEAVTADGHTYSRQVAVAPSPAGVSKQVTVTVDWTDQLGAHQVALVTVIAP
jgi:prepilin-type N-terminal cleavage/methylation domain-containing protein